MTFEAAIRPFEAVTSTPAPGRKPAPPERVAPAAFIRWGAPSDFDDSFRADSAPRAWGFKLADPEPEKRKRREYGIYARGGDEVRYEDPENSDNYVVCLNVRGIGWQDGEARAFFSLREWKPPDDGPDQDPPTPDISEIGERPEWTEWNHRQHT
jgi:hypothetical protein